MGMKKYNPYAPHESWGKRPQTPILAPKWAKWAPKAQKKLKIEIKTQIYVYILIVMWGIQWQHYFLKIFKI